MSEPSEIKFESEFSKKLTVHKNLQQEVLVTTVDKVRICLMNSLNRLTLKEGWVAPLGVFITLVTTLLATDFRDFYLKAEVWNAIYLISTMIVFIWLAKSLYRAFNSKSGVSIEGIIDELKNSQHEQNLQVVVDLFNAVRGFGARTDVAVGKVASKKAGEGNSALKTS